MEMSILNLKDQVFGDAGYSSALTLAASELDSFRQVINAQWLDIINTFHPDLAAEAKALGIQNYHQISNKVDHKKIWAKKIEY